MTNDPPPSPQYNRAITAILGAVMLTMAASPFVLRARSVATLERQYEHTQIGEPKELVLRRISLRMHTGPPPARYRNDVWWHTAGERAACRTWGVAHGKTFAPNYSLIVGFDEHGQVAFKAIGNT